MKGFISAIDISSSEVSAVIGRINSHGRFEILGKGHSNAYGIDRDIFEDDEEMSSVVSAAFNAAKLNAGVEMYESYFCFSSENSGLIDAYARKDFSERGKILEITDAVPIIAMGYEYPLPQNTSIIDVLPLKYFTDQYEGFELREGDKADYLQLEMGIAITEKPAWRNIKNIVAKTGIKPAGYGLSGYCIGYSILTEKERMAGTILINIGTMYTDVSMYDAGGPFFCATIPLGNNDITCDLADSLHLTYEEAEDIRKMYGLASVSLIDDDHKVPVERLNGKTTDYMLSEIISVVEEKLIRIFRIASALVKNEKLGNNEPKHVVLTGIGAVSTEGSAHICAEEMNKNVRLARGMNGFTGRIESASATGLAMMVYDYVKMGKSTLIGECTEKISYQTEKKTLREKMNLKKKKKL